MENNLMSIIREAKKGKILVYYFKTYFLVLLISSLLFAAYSFSVLSAVWNDGWEKTQKELEGCTATIDTLFDEIDGFSDLILSNEKVSAFTNYTNSFGYNNTYKIIDVQNSLLDTSFLEEYILGYFLYFDNSQMVINHNVAYTFQDFYELYMRSTRFSEYSEWLGWFSEQTLGGYELGEMQEYILPGHNNQKTELIPYTKPLLYFSFGDRSRLLIYIKKDALEQLLSPLSSDGIQFIQNSSGKILYQSAAPSGLTEAETLDLLSLSLEKPDSQRIRFHGKSYLCLRCTSRSSHMTYYSFQPASQADTRLTSMVLQFFFFLTCALLVGGGISLFLSRKSAKPLTNLLSEVAQSENSNRKLTSANRELTLELEAQKPLIKNAFYNRLLYGNMESEEELRQDAAMLSFPCEGSVFWTVIFQLIPNADPSQYQPDPLPDAYLLSLQEMIELSIPKAAAVHTGNDALVCIFSVPQQKASQYRAYTLQLLSGILAKIPEAFPFPVQVYGGPCVTRLDEIRNAYTKTTLLYKMTSSPQTEPICWVPDLENVLTEYPSAEIAKILERDILTGNEKGVHDHLEELFRNVFIREDLSAYVQYLIIGELQISFLRILDKLKPEQEEQEKMIRKLESSHGKNILEQIRITQSVYLYCAALANKTLHPSVEASALTAYINLNYRDPDLTLTTTADAFHMNEYYISSIFKQSTGINFSTYVDQVRIQKAQELLRESSLKTKEISEMVGYTSSNSFCRAFKRVTGMNPTDYRNNS